MLAMERPKPRAPRRRASMSENYSSKTLEKSRSKKRLERHSTIGTVNSVEAVLLERVHVQFVKAFIPEGKLARTRYVMKVINSDLNQSWDMVHPFSEFYDFKERLVKALDHGHFCNSNCPWLYMYATHHFPRRHFFRSRSASVISSRLQELEEFLNTILQIFRENQSTDCAITTTVLPRLLYDFLFQGMVFNRTDFNNTSLEDRMSMNGTFQEGTILEEPCAICQQSLFAPPFLPGEVSSPRSSDRTSSAHSFDHMAYADAGKLSCVSLTALECGHRFHDECIVLKLNENLACPLCINAPSPVVDECSSGAKVSMAA
ncbi:TPA: hypothetical protein N0F65_006934 [Lagenidium giganteum]|uniref:RING-type domain-containing protein n=1 Tax=Lagenidium giganteum TaxID=4803 RepID=A0AAV2ZJT5_9STRA|nr:TPA: hypothetical protein N0F65_006934 [Lagenidium giganteum]